VKLGASGDNFSSLESLLVEVAGQPEGPPRAVGRWAEGGSEFKTALERELGWVKGILEAASIPLTGRLSDLEALDSFIDTRFEAGGDLKSESPAVSEQETAKLVVGLGLLTGSIAEAYLGGTWLEHPEANGIALLVPKLGRIFPVARLQRRTMLASGADYGSRLSSLALGIATATASAKFARKELSDPNGVKSYLLAELPALAEFPDEELDGLVKALVSAG
jgi:hypothetical protein